MFSENDKSGFSKIRVNGPCLNLYDQEKKSLPLLFDYQGNGSYIRQDAVIPKIFHLTLSLLAATFSCLLITFYKL